MLPGVALAPAPDQGAPAPAADTRVGGEGVEAAIAPGPYHMGSAGTVFDHRGPEKKIEPAPPAAAPEVLLPVPWVAPRRVEDFAAAPADLAAAGWRDNTAVDGALFGCPAQDPRPSSRLLAMLPLLEEGDDYARHGARLMISPAGVAKLERALTAEGLAEAVEAREPVELAVVKLHPNPQRLEARRVSDGQIVTVRVKDAHKYRPGNPLVARPVAGLLYQEEPGNLRQLLRLCAPLS